VFRTADDQVFALLDRCPHKGGPLSQGIVFGHHVACPLHNWSIGLNDGCARAPDEGCTSSLRSGGGQVSSTRESSWPCGAGRSVTRSPCRGPETAALPVAASAAA
jgi:nitrite reductase/ring-hydroxylating ferredoxin subunit